jgi:hypothetical protein
VRDALQVDQVHRSLINHLTRLVHLGYSDNDVMDNFNHLQNIGDSERPVFGFNPWPSPEVQRCLVAAAREAAGKCCVDFKAAIFCLR